MEPKEFKELIEKIYITTNESGELSKLLGQVQEAHDQEYTNHIENKKLYEEEMTTNSTLAEMNEKLRGVNMDLFLKVGTPPKDPAAAEPPKENIPDLTEVYE